MQSLRIAYRNVLRQAKRNLLLGSAIAFGFLIFTLLNGFTGGLLGSVSENFANISGGHVYVSGSGVSSRGSEISVIRNTAALEAALPTIDDEILSYTARSSAQASLIFGAQEETVEVVGVDFTKESGVLDGLSFAAGSPEGFLGNELGVILPEDIVADLGLELGESVIVKTTTVTGQQNVGDAVVMGSTVAQQTFGPGGATGYVHLGMLNDLMGMDPGQYQTLNIYLKDATAIEPATTALYEALKGTSVVEPRDTESGFGLPDMAELGFGGPASVDEGDRWQGTKFEVTNLNDNLGEFASLVGIINTIGLVIFLVILVIIMVGVANSYRMVMIERTAEIGTMRAMGVHKGGVRNIFLWEALFVALGGTLAGLALALLTMVGVGLIDFGTTGTFSLFLDQGHLAFGLPLLSTLANISLICLMSAAAAYLPARAAAQLQPAEALRAG